MAAMTRTSTLIGWVPPTRKKVRLSSTRSSFTWVESGISPISSRKMVPPSASSNRPSRRSAAPVKAPFSWPNSSDSSSVSGSAAQFTAMNASPRRGERSCSALATSSLPVPLSPWISTVLETGAICSILTSTSWIGGALAHDPGALLQVAPLDQPAGGGHRVVGRDRLGHHLGGAEPLDPLGPLRVGRLQQREGGDLRVVGQGGELLGVGLVHRAGQDHQVGVLPPHRAAGVVQRGEHRGGRTWPPRAPR